MRILSARNDSPERTASAGDAVKTEATSRITSLTPIIAMQDPFQNTNFVGSSRRASHGDAGARSAGYQPVPAGTSKILRRYGLVSTYA